MGLIGGIARTAVVAGTATAVSNRVSRRQGNRWAAKDQQAYDQEADQEQQAAPPPPPAAPPAPVYAAPPPAPVYAAPPPAPVYAAPPAPVYAAPPPAPSQADMLNQLQQLGELKAAGVLTEQEFETQKARILGSA